jgi:hypothetical protein
VKFKIPEELGDKTETRTGAKGNYCALGLAEWLVRTLLLVSAEEYSDGKLPGRRIVQATIKAILETTDGVRQHVFFREETARIYLRQIGKEPR